MTAGTISNVTAAQGFLFTDVTGGATITTNSASQSAVIASVLQPNNNITLAVSQGTVPNGQDLLISGPISGAGGGGGIIKNGAGMVVFANAGDSYTGGTTINAGALQINAANALGTGAAAVNGGTLDLNGYSPSFAAGLSGTGTITSTPAVTVTENIASGTTTWANVFAGSIGLNKTGAGTLVLTGSNVYAGGTTIAAGMLQIGAAARPAASPATWWTTACSPSTVPTTSASAIRSRAAAA